MFDIGFSELCMVGLVSLLVIGPEKLPQVARIVGFWLGKTQNMVAKVKAEIREELHAEDMRQLIQEQAKLYQNFETQVEELHTEVLQDLNTLQAELPQTMADHPTPAALVKTSSNSADEN